ncbi:MAG: MarR family transcriptional regulator [Mangrovicoccus sp.]|nr:MarR family transcriptional regulator [Mangrovicoccus sp.]
MSENARILRQSFIAIVGALKVAENEIQKTHRAFNFSYAELQAIRYVSHHSGCKLSDLATSLGVVPTTASSIIDRLEDRDLIRRERSPTNRRAISLFLTKAGIETFALLEAEELATMDVMLDALDPAERDGFVAQIAQIAQSLSQKRDL